MDTLPGGDTRGYLRLAAERRARLWAAPARKRPDEPTPEPDACSCVAEEKIEWDRPVIIELAPEPDPDAPITEKMTCRFVFEHVAKFYGVSVMDLASARREACIVWPRQIAFYLARLLTLRSLAYIGYRLGGKDHTSVRHGAHKIERELQTNADLQAEITELTRRIEAGEAASAGNPTTLPPPPADTNVKKKLSPWTAERKAELIRMWGEGVGTKRIGGLLGVSDTTVRSWANRLGLPPRSGSEWRFGK